MAIILKKTIAGKPHPGITTDKTSFEALAQKQSPNPVYVLEEGGKDITEIDLADNSLFILGDHVGLPKKAEDLRTAVRRKNQLGKTTILGGFMHYDNQLHLGPAV